MQKKWKTSSGGRVAAGRLALGALVLGLVVGCDDDDVTGLPDAGTQAVSLSVGLKSTAVPSPSLFAQGLELSDGTNTLIIESAELVLREIEFERVESFGCDDDVSGDDDDCEEFETGPFLVSLPLDGSVSTQLTAQVDTGHYDEIELEIHKPDDDTAQDIEFLNQHPSFVDVSIRVTGSYNGRSFSYITDLNEEQEIELTDPLIVTTESGPVNVTLILDLSTWFLDPVGGTFVDPTTALKGQPDEQLVEDNIEASIEGFRDDDGDGVRHGEDDDESDN